jgi:hypothetical protein
LSAMDRAPSPASRSDSSSAAPASSPQGIDASYGGANRTVRPRGRARTGPRSPLGSSAAQAPRRAAQPARAASAGTRRAMSPSVTVSDRVGLVGGGFWRGVRGVCRTDVRGLIPERDGSWRSLSTAHRA